MTKTLSILICDDEPELTAELAEFFSACGWDTHVGSSGHEAQGLLGAGLAPTCLLTDLRMAGGDGADLIAAARGLPDAIRPLVMAVMTGHVGDQTRAEDLGADILYVKPVDPEAMAADLGRLAAAREVAA